MCGWYVIPSTRFKVLIPNHQSIFTPDDFNYFCLFLREYIDGELVESIEPDIEYPVGELKPTNEERPIKVHFMHYDSFEQAKAKWLERKKRINWDNIYVVSTMCYPKEITELTPELIKKWNEIKYKKVMIVDQKYGFDDEFVIKKPADCQEYAWLLCPIKKDDPTLKVFNHFDFESFLNK